jgi:DNA-binding transcriptional ArsR family regulator
MKLLDEKIMDSLARLFKLLSDANRLRILFVIGKEKKSVSEIIEATSLSQTLVSFHLRPLRESGLLTTERRGPFVYYSVYDPMLMDLLVSLCGVSPKEELKEEANFFCPPMRFMRKWMT